MRITRIFEDLQGHESHSSLSQDNFVELLARHKALLLRSDQDEDPWNVDDFAQTIEGLKLTRYEYVGGAGKQISYVGWKYISALQFILTFCLRALT
jgi:hypothetical protein